MNESDHNANSSSNQHKQKIFKVANGMFNPFQIIPDIISNSSFKKEENETNSQKSIKNLAQMLMNGIIPNLIRRQSRTTQLIKQC